MKYLLDTHVILWWLTEQNQLSVKARNAIAHKGNRVFVSSVSFWEMAIKKALGRLMLPRSIIEILTAQGFEMLPLIIHQDPFDRMLVVLVTSDKQLCKYPVDSVKA